MSIRFGMRWIILSMLVVSIGRGQTAQPVADAPDLTPRQQDLLLQLSDAEANIQAINKALKVTGYSVGQAYDRIDSNLKGNELMNRQGGGPVRWDEFYGKTAKDYPSTVFGTMDDRRPQQFKFVYKANNDQIARARSEIASLAKDQQGLLDRRRTHEEDQSRLWATLAWEQVKDREVEFRPLYRFALKPAGPEAAVLRPVIVFLRTAASVAHDGLASVQANQNATFQSGSQKMDAAYTALQQSLADALAASDLTPARVKEGQSLKSLCKELAEQTKVIADDYSNASDRDKAKEDNSKLEFRGQLQSSLSNFAIQFGKLDEEVGQAGAAWDVTADKEKPIGGAAPTVAANPPAPATRGVVAPAATPAVTPTTPVVAPPPETGTRVVNLLSLVDVQRDAVKGRWALVNGALVSDRIAESRIQFPYHPPEEYDFRVVFTRNEGNNEVSQICAAQGIRFKWGIALANTNCGFGLIGKKPSNKNPTERNAARWITNGQEYTSLVKVRKTGVEAYLDGKLISSWATDFSDMSLNREWALRRHDVIGVGSAQSSTTFRTIEVIEITGTGKTLIDASGGVPAQAPGGAK